MATIRPHLMASARFAGILGIRFLSGIASDASSTADVAGSAEDMRRSQASWNASRVALVDRPAR
eukprot:6989510-Lingulodinium_polyedra.AAC.1